MTPLMVAAQDGRDDVLRSLLRRGIPADQKHIATGWTALMVTAMTGMYESSVFQFIFPVISIIFHHQ